jgi:hypothetical protein
MILHIINIIHFHDAKGKMSLVPMVKNIIATVVVIQIIINTYLNRLTSFTIFQLDMKHKKEIALHCIIIPMG